MSEYFEYTNQPTTYYTRDSNEIEAKLSAEVDERNRTEE